MARQPRSHVHSELCACVAMRFPWRGVRRHAARVVRSVHACVAQNIRKHVRLAQRQELFEPGVQRHQRT
eukprot:11116296-Alexandrium_andersonii.AAC.1